MDEGGGGSTCPRLSMRKTLELVLWTWFYCHHNHRQLWNVIRHKKHYKQKGCKYGGVYKPTLPYSLYLYYLFNKNMQQMCVNCYHKSYRDFQYRYYHHNIHDWLTSICLMRPNATNLGIQESEFLNTIVIIYARHRNGSHFYENNVVP